MKKLSVILGAVLCLLALGGCAGKFSGDETFVKNADRAYELSSLIVEDYWESVSEVLTYNIPRDPEQQDIAFAWPYMQTLSMCLRLLSLGGDTDDVRQTYGQLLDGLEYYRGMRFDYLAYCSVRGYDVGTAAGDFFYDDNLWVALELLNAYELLGDDEYLEKAESVAEFVRSGWDEDIGGIYWQENEKFTRNTCSNAPSVVLFVRLYGHTEKEEYLQFARDIYSFVYNNLRDTDNTMWDSIAVERDSDGNKSNGAINTTKWSYNTGMMISAAVHLYDATAEERYLNQAKRFAQAGFETFATQTSAGVYEFTDVPWFDKLLFEGFLDLYPYDTATVGEYIAEVERTMDYAWENSRNDEGYISPAWVSGWSDAYRYKSVLDHSSTAEMYAMLAQYHLGLTEESNA